MKTRLLVLLLALAVIACSPAVTAAPPAMPMAPVLTTAAPMEDSAARLFPAVTPMPFEVLVPLFDYDRTESAQSDSTGLTNVPGVIGLGAAIDYGRALGIGRIETHNLKLRNRLFEMLGSVPQVRIVSPAPGPLASPLLTVQLLDGLNPRELMERMLEKHQVSLKSLPMLPNGMRFSTHLFNSMLDVERAVEGLRIELS